MAAPYDKDSYMPLACFAFEALSVAASSTPFTATTAIAAKMAVAKVEGAQIRYRTDGTAPTATVGVLADPGDVLTVWGSADCLAIRFIRTGGTSATLNTEYFK